MVHKVHALLKHFDPVVLPRSQQIDLKLMHKLPHPLGLYAFLHYISQHCPEILLKCFTSVIMVDALQSYRKSSQFGLVVTSKAQVLRDSTFNKPLIHFRITLFQKHIGQHSQRHGLQRSDLIIKPKEVIDGDVVGLCSL